MTISIRGNTQIKSGTVPFSAVNYAFPNDLFATKSVTDFVQFSNIPVSESPSLDVTSNLLGQPLNNVNSISGRPDSSDLGFIVSLVSGSILPNSRVLVRNSLTGDPLLVSGTEVFGYLYSTSLVSGSQQTIEWYRNDGISEVPVVFPSGTNIDFQLYSRFTFDTVKEGFAANEKFVTGVTDVTELLNLIQLAKDLYGPTYSLNNDGQATLGTSLADQIINHLNDTTDAHPASAISFISGTTGLNATDVQTAIVELIDYIQNSSSGPLQEHIDAPWSGTSAHRANQIRVDAYLVSGTYNLVSGSLQENLEDILDRSFATQELLETHFTGNNAHEARSIDVLVSGTYFGTHFPTLVASGTVDLQEFLRVLDVHNHESIDSLSGTILGEVSRIEDVIGIVNGANDFTASGTFTSGTSVRSVVESLDTELTHTLNVLGVSTSEPHTREFNSLVNSGTQLSVNNTDTFAFAIDKIRANTARHINLAIDAHAASAISFISGTTLINADNVQSALVNIANRINRIEVEQVEFELLPPVDAVNPTYTLNYSIKPGSVPMLWVNGVTQLYSGTFNYSGDQLQYIGGPIELDDQLWLVYKRIIGDIS